MQLSRCWFLVDVRCVTRVKVTVLKKAGRDFWHQEEDLQLSYHNSKEKQWERTASVGFKKEGRNLHRVGRQQLLANPRVNGSTLKHQCVGL